MNARSATWIGLVLAASVAAVAFLYSRVGSGGTAPRDSANHEPASSADAPLAEENRADAAATRVAERSPEVAPPPVRESPAAPPEAAEGRIRGIVIDTGGEPVPAASVELRRAATRGFSLPRPLSGEDSPSVSIAEAESDGEGRFAFEAAPFALHDVAARAEGYGVAAMRHVAAGSEITLTLVAGATVQGVVVGPAGDPRVDARVRVLLRGGTDVAEAVTGAEGRFAVADLHPGSYYVAASDRGAAPSDYQPVHLESGEVRDLRLELPAGLTVKGRVIDASTRLPIESAGVSNTWTFERTWTTDSDGEFEIVGIPEHTKHLYAIGWEHGPREVLLGRFALDDVTIELDRGWNLRGVVVGPLDEPVEGALVAVAASDYRSIDRSLRSDGQSETTDDSGGFVFRNLRADMRYSLFVRKEGFGTTLLDVPEAKPGESVDLGRVYLHEPGALLGRVVDEFGRPFARHRVELRGANFDRARLTGGEPLPDSYVDGYLAERWAITGADGRFGFVDVAPGDYTLSASLEESKRPVHLDVTIGGGEVREGLVLELVRGLAIGGEIRLPSGVERPTLYLSVDPEDTDSAADAEVEPDGSFLCEGLAPGSYSLTVYAYATAEQEAEGIEFVSKTLRGVKAGTTGIVFEFGPAMSVSGIVVDDAGVPLEGVRVIAYDGMGYSVGGADSGPKGAFRVPVGPGDPVHLRASHGAEPELSGAVMDVHPGAQGLVLELRP